MTPQATSAEYAAMLESVRDRAAKVVDDLQALTVNSNADNWLHPTALVIPLEDVEVLAGLLPGKSAADRAERRLRAEIERDIEDVQAAWADDGRLCSRECGDDHHQDCAVTIAPLVFVEARKIARGTS